MGSVQKPEVTEQEVKTAQDFWLNFTTFMKIGIVFVVGLLASMALFLV